MFSLDGSATAAALQIVLFVLGWAVALAILLRARDRADSGPLGRWAFALVLLLLITSAFSVQVWRDSEARRRESREALVREIPGALAEEAEYVSSDRCQTCHPGEYASWHDSFHRTMTQEALPANVLGDFDDRVLSARGRTYRLERRGDEYWVEMVDPDWERDQIDARRRPGRAVSPPRVWKRIVMTTGSHHMQTYWTGSERDGRLFNFPWLWLTTEQRWIPREEGFIRPPKGGRTYDVWHDSCIECHAVAGEKARDAQGKWEPQTAELGIACEACHGPAEAHIEMHQNPARRYTSRLVSPANADRKIVNPAKLDAPAASQVCGQCHGINLFKPAPLAAGERYRPGGNLRDTRIILRATQPESPAAIPEAERADWRRMRRHIDSKLAKYDAFLADRFWPDGMVRVSGREHNGMIESACFEGGELSCLSCHSMHESAPDDQLSAAAVGDRACLNCHPRFAEDISAHTHHAPDSPGSRCYNCHMPHTVYGLLKSIRSHWIDIPSVETELATGRTNACNLCHLDRTTAWTARRLRRWFGTPMPDLSAQHRTVASGVRQLLTGNAHQRAMTAWHMGWPEARMASGDDWMPFFLGHLLEDPYPAVRFNAERSLRAQGGAYRDLPYDFLDDPTASGKRKRSMAAEVAERWRESASKDAGRVDAALLMPEPYSVDPLGFGELAAQRDDRPMDLRE